MAELVDSKCTTGPPLPYTRPELIALSTTHAAGKYTTTLPESTYMGSTFTFAFGS